MVICNFWSLKYNVEVILIFQQFYNHCNQDLTMLGMEISILRIEDFHT